MDVMYYALYRPPTKVMILGAGCSIASEPTARSSHLWNLVQVGIDNNNNNNNDNDNNDNDNIVIIITKRVRK